MDSRRKKSLFKHINAYFIFVAMAFTIGAYVFFVDNSGVFVVQGDVLVKAKNEKTALNLDRIKETLVILAQKNDIVPGENRIRSDKKANIIEFEVKDSTQFKASEKTDLLMRNFIDFAGKYYNFDEDLELEIISKQVYKKEINNFYLLLVSVAIGIALSLVVQVILNFVESAIKKSILNSKLSNKENRSGSKELERMLKINREKIQRLSVSNSPEGFRNYPENAIESREFLINKVANQDLERKIERETALREPSFKKASSPINLPIAQEDREIFERDTNESDIPVGIPFIDKNEVKNLEERVFGSISHANHSHDVVFAKNTTIVENEVVPREEEQVKEAPKAFVEPTEEDFKRKLNQLLGNR